MHTNFRLTASKIPIEMFVCLTNLLGLSPMSTVHANYSRFHIGFLCHMKRGLMDVRKELTFFIKKTKRFFSSILPSLVWLCFGYTYDSSISSQDETLGPHPRSRSIQALVGIEVKT